MTTVQICGFCLTALFTAMVLRQLQAEYASLVTLAASCAVLLCGVRCLYPFAAYLEKIAADAPEKEYLAVILRGVGIGVLTATCADLCRDAGESALAGKIEFLGKAELLVLSLPLLRELTDGVLSFFA